MNGKKISIDPSFVFQMKEEMMDQCAWMEKKISIDPSFVFQMKEEMMDQCSWLWLNKSLEWWKSQGTHLCAIEINQKFFLCVCLSLSFLVCSVKFMEYFVYDFFFFQVIWCKELILPSWWYTCIACSRLLPKDDHWHGIACLWNIAYSFFFRAVEHNYMCIQRTSSQ